MTTRETSREAYKLLVASGQLKGCQVSALDAIIRHGPATSAEIITRAMLGGNTNCWRARFTELQARGLIREIGQRKCKVTGRTALVWEATGRTKPLDVKRGHRTRDLCMMWRELAEYAIANASGEHRADLVAAGRRIGLSL